MKILAVISGSPSEGNVDIIFNGTYNACIDYMKTHNDWDDLMYLNKDGSIGRYASWVLV